MLGIQENVDLKNFSTMKIGGRARYFAVIESNADIVEGCLYAQKYNVPYIVVGSGSNMIWSDTLHNIFLFENKIHGFETIDEDDISVTIRVGAGENWDETVSYCVELGLSGIEAMSAIPGTVGATPVQNVGAYGQEIQNTILSVEVYDTVVCEFRNLSNTECKFGYRDSIFKSEEKGRYIILRVVLHLSKFPPVQPKYPSLVTYFKEKNITTPSLEEIRQAVIEIRKNKLPDPKTIPNCGSFFKNPIVEKNIVDKLLLEYPSMQYFVVDENYIKISAGWLLEMCGLKGVQMGRMKLYDANALVLTNPDGASFADLVNVKEHIVDIVKEKFGITLENEPNII